MLFFVKLPFLLTEATVEHDAGYQDQKANRDDWDRSDDDHGDFSLVQREKPRSSQFSQRGKRL